MKTISNHFLFLCLLLSSATISAQTEEMSLLTITVYESYVQKGYSKIVVVKDETKVEEIPLSLLVDNSDSHHPAIHRTILKYRKEGYRRISELRGGFSSQGGFMVMVTTFMFEK